MTNRLNNLLKIASITILAFASCAKELEDATTQQSEDAVMLFAVEEIVQTKVSYDDQDNGGLSAEFDAGDNIGVYAFYNNFYYYYNDYGVFAESVIFANQGMYVGEESNLVYSPLRNWTFSTLYGTAPNTLDVMAYYPLVEGYHPEQIAMINDDTGAATFEYYYVYDQTTTAEDDEGGITTTTTTIVNSDVDFMTAHTRYDEYDDSADFRTAMLSKESIPLEFTRQLATLNLQVTKPDYHSDEIIVTGITVHFDAYTKFTQAIGSKDDVNWDKMTEGYSLTATVSDLAVKLAMTVWTDTPSEEASNDDVDDLLGDDPILFFPPATEIWKIVFTLTDKGESKTYTWHPHIDTIVANTHYTLSLELDPARAN